MGLLSCTLVIIIIYRVFEASNILLDSASSNCMSIVSSIEVNPP